MRKLVILLALAILGSGCTSKGVKNFLKPIPARMGKPAENAPPRYKEGWNDGCETGLSTMVQGYYKTFYEFKQNTELANDGMYYKAWKDAYTYCRQYSFRYGWEWGSYDWSANAAVDNKLCILCPNEVR